jgi:hypothetical protein
MRKVIRKRIRRDEEGLNLAADLDVAIAVTTGEDAQASRTVVRSSHSVVQGGAGQRDQPEPTQTDHEGPPKEKS